MFHRDRPAGEVDGYVFWHRKERFAFRVRVLRSAFRVVEGTRSSRPTNSQSERETRNAERETDYASLITTWPRAKSLRRACVTQALRPEPGRVFPRRDLRGPDTPRRGAGPCSETVNLIWRRPNGLRSHSSRPAARLRPPADDLRRQHSNLLQLPVFEYGSNQFEVPTVVASFNICEASAVIASSSSSRIRS